VVLPGAGPKGGFVLGRILYHPLPTALVLLALLVVAASCGASPGGGARQGEQQPSEDPAASEGVGNPTLGAADAPVEMIEWGDFQ
jgi:hypothetical protein